MVIKTGKDKLDKALQFLYYMHITWPTHEHYFCNETAMSILFCRKIKKLTILTSTLPEYLHKRFNRSTLSTSVDNEKYTFEVMWNGMKYEIICINEYPFMEMYKEKYAACNAELLLIDWENMLQDPFNVKEQVIGNKINTVFNKKNWEKFDPMKQQYFTSFFDKLGGKTEFI